LDSRTARSIGVIFTPFFTAQSDGSGGGLTSVRRIAVARACPDPPED
jgi:signal transduction histidine kinase